MTDWVDPIESARDLAEFDKRLDVVFAAVRRELHRARTKHGRRPFASHHEGFAVLLEEVDELKADCWADRLSGEAQMEALQVAAMAIRFVLDIPIRTNTKRVPSILPVASEGG